MNLFYTEPKEVSAGYFRLLGQEARHASKVLRIREGDEVYATDGKGSLLKGEVENIGKDAITAFITGTEQKSRSEPELVLAMGIIKKRDRLEFAVEKAVELGVSEIILFNSDHTEKTKVRMDRLENITLSAMKQSLRLWLPQVAISDSLDDVLQEHPNDKKLMAHEKVKKSEWNPEPAGSSKIVLFIGPEGGFSEREVNLAEENDADLVSLGDHRLRAETAAVAFLSQYLLKK